MSRQGPFREGTHENIKAFWEKEAEEIGESPQVTIRDFYFRIHELHTLLPLIPAVERLLDIGCGTGFGTLVFSRRANYTLGIDYSNHMIRWAKKLKSDLKFRERLSKEFSPLWEIAPVQDHQIEFQQADLTSLDLKTTPFNVIAGERVLINLPTHDAQMKVLKILRKQIAKEGFLFLVEPTIQGYERTDDYRSLLGLPPLEKYWHNCYLDETRWSDWEGSGWKVQTILHFNTYPLLSKVIYPAACGEENCRFLSGANAAAMEMASLFRTKKAADEIGEKRFLEMYTERVRLYDEKEAERIKARLDEKSWSLPDWGGIGNQKLIVARPD